MMCSGTFSNIHSKIYSTCSKRCTRFYCVSFVWLYFGARWFTGWMYPYSSGLLHWHWNNLKLAVGPVTWWRHQMETFSAKLALCVGISPVPVNSPHKSQWRGALIFSLICVWINGWVNNHEAGDLWRHRGHYDTSVMEATVEGVSKLIGTRPQQATMKGEPSVYFVDCIVRPGDCTCVSTINSCLFVLTFIPNPYDL